MIFSAFITSPPTLGWGGYAYFPLESTCLFEWGSSRSYIPSLFLMCVCGPVSMMIYCYSNIILVVRASNRKIQAFNQQQGVAVVMSSGNPHTSRNIVDVENSVDQTNSTSSKNFNQTLKQTLRQKEELKPAMSFLNIKIGAVCISVVPNCMVYFLMISSVPLSRGTTMPFAILIYSYCFTTLILYMKLNTKYMAAFTRIFMKQTCRRKKDLPISLEGTTNGVNLN